MSPSGNHGTCANVNVDCCLTLHRPFWRSVPLVYDRENYCACIHTLADVQCRFRIQTSLRCILSDRENVSIALQSPRGAWERGTETYFLVMAPVTCRVLTRASGSEICGRTEVLHIIGIFTVSPDIKRAGVGTHGVICVVGKDAKVNSAGLSGLLFCLPKVGVLSERSGCR